MFESYTYELLLKDVLDNELCVLINARPSTICDLCNNNAENVKLKLLEEICIALGCNISDILSIV